MKIRSIRRFGIRGIAAVLAAVRSDSRRLGACPVCESRTLFFSTGDWLREDYKCLRCHSSSRQRALAFHLTAHFPMLSQLSVYEPAPSGAVTRWLERKCGRFICSHFFDDQALGQTVQGYRNESLEHLSFDDRSFDIVITQDVFEHIENPRSAFKEVERVLKPGGSHVFTIPYYPGQLTEARVRIVNGAPVSAHELEYHGNPIDNAGSLVFTRFGSDLKDIVFRESGMRTSIHPLHEPGAGIEGESVIIFHSRKE